MLPLMAASEPDEMLSLMFRRRGREVFQGVRQISATIQKGNTITMRSVLFCRVGMGFCVSLTLVLPAAATPTQDARKAIQAAYAGMDKAIGSRDTSAYAVYLDPNIVGIDEKGKETNGKVKTIQLLGQAFKLFRAAASKTEILTLALRDGGAVVTTHTALSFSATRNGQPIVVKGENQVRDFWSKASGRWLLKQERVISNTQTLSGQPAR